MAIPSLSSILGLETPEQQKKEGKSQPVEVERHLGSSGIPRDMRVDPDKKTEEIVFGPEAARLVDDLRTDDPTMTEKMGRIYEWSTGRYGGEDEETSGLLGEIASSAASAAGLGPVWAAVKGLDDVDSAVALPQAAADAVWKGGSAAITALEAFSYPERLSWQATAGAASLLPDADTTLGKAAQQIYAAWPTIQQTNADPTHLINLFVDDGMAERDLTPEQLQGLATSQRQYAEGVEDSSDAWMEALRWTSPALWGVVNGAARATNLAAGINTPRQKMRANLYAAAADGTLWEAGLSEEAKERSQLIENVPYIAGTDIVDAQVSKEQAALFAEQVGSEHPDYQYYNMLSSDLGREIIGLGYELAFDPLWFAGPAKGGMVVHTAGKTVRMGRSGSLAARALDNLAANVGGPTEAAEIIVRAAAGDADALKSIDEAIEIAEMAARKYADDASKKGELVGEANLLNLKGRQAARVRSALGDTSAPSLTGDAERLRRFQQIADQKLDQQQDALRSLQKAYAQTGNKAAIESAQKQVAALQRVRNESSFDALRLTGRLDLMRAANINKQAGHLKALRKRIDLGEQVFQDAGRLAYHVPFSSETRYLSQAPIISPIATKVKALNPLKPYALKALQQIVDQGGEAALSAGQKLAYSAQRTMQTPPAVVGALWDAAAAAVGTRAMQPMTAWVRSQDEISTLLSRGREALQLTSDRAALFTVQRLEPELWNRYQRAINQYTSDINNRRSDLQQGLRRATEQAQIAVQARKALVKEDPSSWPQEWAAPGYGVQNVLNEAFDALETGAGLLQRRPEMQGVANAVEAMVADFARIHQKSIDEVRQSLVQMARWARGNPEMQRLQQAEMRKHEALAEIAVALDSAKTSAARLKLKEAQATVLARFKRDTVNISQRAKDQEKRARELLAEHKAATAALVKEAKDNLKAVKAEKARSIEAARKQAKSEYRSLPQLDEKLNKPLNMQDMTRDEFAEIIEGADSASEVVNTIALMSSDAGHRAIATRIRHLVADEDLRFVVVKPGSGPSPLAIARGRARGMYQPKQGEPDIIWLRGPQVDGSGISSETVLHELLHAVTSRKLHNARARANQGTPLSRAERQLNDITGVVIRKWKEHYRKTGEVIGPSSLNADEVLAWGLTNPDFQKFLQGIELRGKTTLWQGFVKAIGDLLGIPSDKRTALTELLRVSDDIFEGKMSDLKFIRDDGGKPFLSTIKAKRAEIKNEKDFVASRVKAAVAAYEKSIAAAEQLKTQKQMDLDSALAQNMAEMLAEGGVARPVKKSKKGTINLAEVQAEIRLQKQQRMEGAESIRDSARKAKRQAYDAQVSSLASAKKKGAEGISERRRELAKMISESQPRLEPPEIIVGKAPAGRLTADQQLKLKEFDSAIAANQSKLASTPANSPEVSKIQGKLEDLEAKRQNLLKRNWILEDWEANLWGRFRSLTGQTSGLVKTDPQIAILEQSIRFLKTQAERLRRSATDTAIEKSVRNQMAKMDMSGLSRDEARLVKVQVRAVVTRGLIKEAKSIASDLTHQQAAVQTLRNTVSDIASQPSLSREDILLAAFSLLKNTPKIPGFPDFDVSRFPQLVGRRLGELPDDLVPVVDELSSIQKSYEKLFEIHRETFIKDPTAMLEDWGVVSWVPHILSDALKRAKGSSPGAEARGVDKVLSQQTDSRRTRKIAGTVAEINASNKNPAVAFVLNPNKIAARYMQENRALAADDFLSTMVGGGLVRFVTPNLEEGKGIAQVALDEDLVPLLERGGAQQQEMATRLLEGFQQDWASDPAFLDSNGQFDMDMFEEATTALMAALKPGKDAPMATWLRESRRISQGANIEYLTFAIKKNEMTTVKEQTRRLAEVKLTDPRDLHKQYLSATDGDERKAWDLVADALNTKANELALGVRTTGQSLDEYYGGGSQLFRMYIPRVVASSMEDVFKVKPPPGTAKRVWNLINDFWKTRVTVLSLAFSMRNAISNQLTNILDLGVGGAMSPVTQTKAGVLTAAIPFIEQHGSWGKARRALSAPKRKGESATAFAKRKAQHATYLGIDAMLSTVTVKGTSGRRLFDLGDGTLRTMDEAHDLLQENNIIARSFQMVTDLNTFADNMGSNFIPKMATDKSNLDKLEHLAHKSKLTEGYAIVALSAALTGGIPVAVPRRMGAAVSRSIENQARLMNFIGNMRRGHTIADSAAHVQKFLFDYGDLTPFQRDTIRMFIPFFTWTFKNVRLQINQMIENPQFYATYNRIMMDALPDTMLAYNVHQQKQKLPEIEEEIASLEAVDRLNLTQTRRLGTLKSQVVSIRYAQPRPYNQYTDEATRGTESYARERLRVPIGEGLYVEGFATPQEAFFEEISMIRDTASAVADIPARLGVFGDDAKHQAYLRGQIKGPFAARYLARSHIMAKLASEVLSRHHLFYDRPIESLTNGRTVGAMIDSLEEIPLAGQLPADTLRSLSGYIQVSEGVHKPPSHRVDAWANYALTMAMPSSRHINDALAMSQTVNTSAVADPSRENLASVDPRTPFWRVLDGYTGIAVKHIDPDAVSERSLREVNEAVQAYYEGRSWGYTQERFKVDQNKR